jgi:hypothetical protein
VAFTARQLNVKNTVATRKLGAISAFAWSQRNERKLLEMAGGREFRMRINFQAAVRPKNYKQ